MLTGRKALVELEMDYNRENKSYRKSLIWVMYPRVLIWAYDSAAKALSGPKSKTNFVLGPPCDDRSASLSSTVEPWSSPNNNTNNDTRWNKSSNKAETQDNIDLDIAQEEFGRKNASPYLKDKIPNMSKKQIAFKRSCVSHRGAKVYNLSRQ